MNTNQINGSFIIVSLKKGGLLYTGHCFKGGISGMHTNTITCIESYMRV